MYILLCGNPPFNGDTDQDITKNVIEGIFYFDDPIWCSISEEAKNLIKEMLTLNFKKRKYAKDFLEDPWFQIAPK